MALKFKTWSDLVDLPPSPEELNFPRDMPLYEQREKGLDDRWYALMFLTLDQEWVLEFLERFIEAYPGRRCRVGLRCFREGLCLDLMLPEAECGDRCDFEAVDKIGNGWVRDNMWRVAGRILVDVEPLEWSDGRE